MITFSIESSYCTLGVPFTLVLLKAITEKLMDLTSQFLEYLNTKLGM